MEKRVGILLLLVILVSSYFLLEKFYDYQAGVCYENIGTVHIGDNYLSAMKKMKRGTLFIDSFEEVCLEHKNSSDKFMRVVFKYRDTRDPISEYPYFCYSVKTGKVVKVYSGLHY